MPASSELDIEAYAILPNLKITKSKWASMLKFLESSLLIAGTLLPYRMIDLTVRVMNPSGRAIHLKKGFQCELEGVELMKTKPESSQPLGCVVITCVVITELLTDEINRLLKPLSTEIAENVPT